MYKDWMIGEKHELKVEGDSKEKGHIHYTYCTTSINICSASQRALRGAYSVREQGKRVVLSERKETLGSTVNNKDEHVKKWSWLVKTAQIYKKYILPITRHLQL